MKTILIAAFALIVSAAASAQAPQKLLPKKVTIQLTDAQVVRIDSLLQAVVRNLDSKRESLQVFRVFDPFYTQVGQQMVADTTKAPPVKPPAKKKN